MPHRIRPVHNDDSAALIELIGTCWAEYPGCVLDVDREEPWLREPASAYRRAGGGFWVVDGPDGAVHGSAGFKPLSAEQAELKGVYVAQAARRAGVGRALVGHVEARARAQAVRGIAAWSDTRFVEAHSMYERLGYRLTGRSRDLNDLSNTTELEFVKEL